MLRTFTQAACILFCFTTLLGVGPFLCPLHPLPFRFLEMWLGKITRVRRIMAKGTISHYNLYLMTGIGTRR